MKTIFTSSAEAILVFSIVLGNAFGQIQYTVTDLGALQTTGYSRACGINNLGEVVGTASVGAYEHGFLYTGGKMVDLGSPNSDGDATGINDLGQVVGVSGSYAYIYTCGHRSNLGLLAGCNFSCATSINNSGQVVGFSQDDSLNMYAFSSDGKLMTALTMLPGYGDSKATGINNHGVIVGDAMGPYDKRYVFIYDGGGMSVLDTLPGYEYNYANAINDVGQVVGSAFSGTHSHAFLYCEGSMTDLGTLPGCTDSYAMDINEHGQIVGYSYSSSGASIAFLYSHGVITDLDSMLPLSSRWTLTTAFGINDSGEIVATGYNSAVSSRAHAVLLTPIPEPSTLVLLGIGAITLLTYAWRRKR